MGKHDEVMGDFERLYQQMKQENAELKAMNKAATESLARIANHHDKIARTANNQAHVIQGLERQIRELEFQLRGR